MSIKLGTTDIAGISTHTISNAHSLFDFKWADHELDDMSWVRADTFSWQSGDTYTSAYNHLVQDIQGKTAETETIGSYTITFYRATDGHKICLADQESIVLNIYNSYGVAWYYLLDSANTQFKFPRTKYGFEGLRTNVGDNISESLPTPSHTHTRGDMNITGGLRNQGLKASGESYTWGAFYYSQDSGKLSYALTDGTIRPGYAFDASRSWTGSTSQPNGLPSIYQNNAPVQERATQMYLYFYVGDYSQSAVQQTAGLNAELFNNKLDLNANNLSTQGMSYIAGMGMPSNKYINLTIGASGATYTAPANGYYNICRFTNGQNDQYVDLVNTTTGFFVSLQKSTMGVIRLNAPVRKGDILLVNYTATGSSENFNFFRFYYAQGSESEGN